MIAPDQRKKLRDTIAAMGRTQPGVAGYLK